MSGIWSAFFVNNLLIVYTFPFYTLLDLYYYVATSLRSAFGRITRFNPSAFVISNCKWLACVNPMYCKVSIEISLLNQTRLLFWFKGFTTLLPWVTNESKPLVCDIIVGGKQNEDSHIGSIHIRFPNEIDHWASALYVDTWACRPITRFSLFLTIRCVFHS